jgi:peptidoglycan/LPS O-acetylase OafA/YrhL
LLRILPAAVAILAACGMLATAAFDRSADVTEAPRLIPAPSAAPVAVAAGDTSVPDASTVFSSRQLEVEEPMPTF